METTPVLDLFAAAGGWDEAYVNTGRSSNDVTGFEMDPWACESAEANGHRRVRGDLTQLNPNDYAHHTDGRVGKIDLLLGGPPCQAWSVAGKRLGQHDQIECINLLKAYAEGNDDYAHQVDWNDPRSQLISEPMRWIRELAPANIALENVPTVLSMWREYQQVLEQLGYQTWAGVLNAEQYGVPQTRRRAFLMASYAGSPAAPEPTHSKFYANNRTKVDEGTLPWVSMAQALGWGWIDRPSTTVAAGSGGKQSGSTWGGSTVRKEMHEADEQARYYLRSSNMKHAVARSIHEPAFTMTFGNNSINMRWYPKDESLLRRGQQIPTAVARNDSIRVSYQEAACLQSFRADFEWHGTSTNRYTQIGNAVPPKLGAAVISRLLA